MKIKLIKKDKKDFLKKKITLIPVVNKQKKITKIFYLEDVLDLDNSNDEIEKYSKKVRCCYNGRWKRFKNATLYKNFFPNLFYLWVMIR